MAGSPVAQQQTPAASATALKQWFDSIILHCILLFIVRRFYDIVVPANGSRDHARVPTGDGWSQDIFHHLVDGEFGAITLMLQAPGIIAWHANLIQQNPPRSAGKFFMTTSEGKGKAQAILQRFCPFV